MQRKKHSQAKVALEALKGLRTANQIASETEVYIQHGLHFGRSNCQR
jgi:hypothetical protein